MAYMPEEAYHKWRDQMLAYLDAPTSDLPESVCHKCKGPNPVWFAPSELWNAVMRSPGYESEPFDGIVCPVCFIRLAEAAGHKPTAWKLAPEDLGA